MEEISPGSLLFTKTFPHFILWSFNLEMEKSAYTCGCVYDGAASQIFHLSGNLSISSIGYNNPSDCEKCEHIRRFFRLFQFIVLILIQMFEDIKQMWLPSPLPPFTVPDWSEIIWIDCNRVPFKMDSITSCEIDQNVLNYLVKKMLNLTGDL